jgi:hypothetical protein
MARRVAASVWREVLGHPNADNHLVQFTRDPSFLQAAVSSWLAPGLLRGGGAIVLTTPEHWRIARMSLRDHGLNPAQLEAEDRIVVLDVYDFIADFMRDGRPRTQVFKNRISTAVEQTRAASPNEEIRAWGEAVDVLRQNHNLLAAQFLEALWNEAIAEHDLRLLCTYGVDTLDLATHTAPLHELAARHGTIIPASDYARLNTAVEYALIAAMIVLSIVTVLKFIGADAMLGLGPIIDTLKRPPV